MSGPDVGDPVDRAREVVADVERAVRADRKTRRPAERIDVTVPQETGGERLRVAGRATVPGQPPDRGWS